MDILSKQLDEAAIANRFQTHPKCSNPLITHLSFADDILIFFDGNEASLVEILDVLAQFKRVSGLGINLQKTCLYLDGDNRDTISQLASAHNLTYGSLPFRYLGVPLLTHKLTASDYQPLIDKVKGRISSWTNRHLSFAGRLQLLHSVINNTINFWASIFLLPTKCLEMLEQICNAFLWNGIATTARGAKVSWEIVCSPESSGGLGLKRLVDWNKIFGLKLIWLLFSQAGSLWVSWVNKHLIKDKSFWEADFSASGSWIWRRLTKIRALGRPFVHCTVNSGDLGPRVTGIGQLAKVSDAVNNVPTPDMGSDTFHWKLPSDQTLGSFSSMRTWRYLHPAGPNVPWSSQVWNQEITYSSIVPSPEIYSPAYSINLLLNQIRPLPAL
ncbi:PREDICTED: uncharacterized protein LOC104715049 [Camelina sativa]|uniref:Uncharacterized protein LOC104715049 n=1 Tax=Camelina sativa TaxID=90675 RepID=A0ABM1QF81_CAMSA|nr:PREDICTED: uncharacterized protein LOC104715049 [Camelina sativa]